MRFTCRPVLIALALISSTQFAVADDWKPLFNGKDMTGWQAVGNSLDNWKVDGDVFYCGGGGGWLATTDEYANFELDLEFKLCEGGNSGVFLRAPLSGGPKNNPAFDGMEVQILDNDAPQYKGKLQSYQYCGGLYGLQAPSEDVHKKVGEWQKYHIVCNGKQVQVTLNDKPIIDADLAKLADHKDSNPGIERDKGHIGLQVHDGRIDFRNVKIKVLP